MRFCETNPFVMLANSPLTDVKVISYVDYMKMTNGFVFDGIGGLRRQERTRRSASLRGDALGYGGPVHLDSTAAGRYEGGSVSGREFTL